MSFQGRHGVRPDEREHPQEFKVDLDIEADLSRAGKSDLLVDTVDYRQAHAAVKRVIEGESRQLLEAIASEIAELVLALPRVERVWVRIAKRPAGMQPIEAAAVRIERTRA